MIIVNLLNEKTEKLGKYFI